MTRRQVRFRSCSSFSTFLVLNFNYLGEPIKRFAFVTCGDWDIGKMLPMQCEREGIEIPPYFRKGWVNIKTIFGVLYKRKRVNGMASMLNILNMELIGHHHSGIDDCRCVTFPLSPSCHFFFSLSLSLSFAFLFSLPFSLLVIAYS